VSREGVMPAQSAWALVLGRPAQRELRMGRAQLDRERVRIVLGTGLGFVAICDE